MPAGPGTEGKPARYSATDNASVADWRLGAPTAGARTRASNPCCLPRTFPAGRPPENRLRAGVGLHTPRLGPPRHRCRDPRPTRGHPPRSQRRKPGPVPPPTSRPPEAVHRRLDQRTVPRSTHQERVRTCLIGLDRFRPAQAGDRGLADAATGRACTPREGTWPPRERERSQDQDALGSNPRVRAIRKELHADGWIDAAVLDGGRWRTCVAASHAW